MLGQHATQGDAQHRPEHAARHEGACQGSAHFPREHRYHHGNADTAIGGFADADEESGEEHLLEVFSQSAAEGGQAPEPGHQRQAPDPAEAVGDQRKREGQEADHYRDYAAEQAELAVREGPFGLEQGEHGIEHLP
ncbi:hypothetical protein D9M71_389550 [compost metagenome]